MRLANLKARPDLNGKLALVHSFNAESGRWNVGVLDPELHLALKPGSLEVVEDHREESDAAVMLS